MNKIVFAATSISDGLYVKSVGNLSFGARDISFAVHQGVAVTNVTLNPSTAQTIDVGGKVSITATVEPNDAVNKKVKWSTNNSNVALYSNEACTTPVGTDATDTLTVYAKGVAGGTAQVVATANADPTKTATCDVTVNVPAPTYTVTWKNDDGTELEKDENVAEGATPTYDGEAPTKAEDEQNTYTFSGWNDGQTTYGLSDTLPAVSGDVTYTATFDATPKTPAADAFYVKVTSEPDDWSGDYLIVYEDEDGSTAFNGSADELNSNGNYIDVTISGGEIESNAATDAAKVTIAQIDGGYSIATANGTYIGGASGQNKMDYRDEAILNTISLENNGTQIVSNTSTLRFNTSWIGFRYYKTVSQKPVQLYKLTGGSAPTTYTVTWKNGDTVLETDENVAEGSTPTYDGEAPTKDEDDDNTYEFAGWSDGETTYGLNDALPEVTADVTYTAVFTAVPKPVELPDVIKDCTYEFPHLAGIYANVPFVTQSFNELLTGAILFDGYIGDTMHYSYTFYDQNGTDITPALIDSSTTPGDNLGFSEDVTMYVYDYGFKSSMPNPLYIVATAPPGYTVTWKNWNGTELEKDENVAEGATPTYDGETPVRPEDANNTYTFSAWDDGTTTYVLGVDDLPPVTGDVTYTAVFTADPITYTVTWKNWDGTDLEVDTNVAKNTPPTYDGEAPVRPDDANNTYTFSAWDDGTTTYVLGVDDLPPVTGDVTYTAVYTGEPKKLFVGHSVTLGGDIGVNFFIDGKVAGVDTAETAVVKFAWDGGNYIEEVNLKDLTPDNDGLYKATVNVAAAQMAHKIEAVAYINGNMIYTPDLYSVQDYAEKVIAEPEKYEPEKPEQLKALAEAMLHYGGEAQTVFDSALYSHPDRADSHLDAPDYSGVTEDAIRAAINGEASDLNEVAAQLDAEFYASTLVYLSKSTLRIYFTPASKTVGAFDGMDFSGNKNRYYYYTEVEDIAAAELDDQQYFSVNGVNFNYSVLDYVIALLNNSKMNDVQKNLAKSLFLYNQAANDYFDGGSEPAPAVTSFTKVTDVDQIAEENIGECTFAAAKAWVLDNWDDVANPNYDVEVVYFDGTDLKCFSIMYDMSKQQFENMVTDGAEGNVSIGDIQYCFTDWGDDIYLCSKAS